MHRYAVYILIRREMVSVPAIGVRLCRPGRIQQTNGTGAIHDPVALNCECVRSRCHLPRMQKDGGVYVFDLHDDLTKPVAILRDKDSVCPVQFLSFNPKYVQWFELIVLGFANKCVSIDHSVGGSDRLNATASDLLALHPQHRQRNMVACGDDEGNVKIW